MKSAVIDSATTVLGKKPTTRWDWFDDSKTEILDTLEKKKEAHLNRVRNPSQANEEAYNKARSETQREIRQLKEKWWTEKVKEMQHYSDINDTHNLHRCIKNIVGPTKKALNVIETRDGEKLKSKEDIKKRWRKHFNGVLNQDTIVNLDSIRAPSRPQTEEEQPDDPPSSNEIRRAVGQLKNNKSAGSDAITAELLKGGGETIINMFTALFKKVWEEKHVPKDWTDAIVVPLHKKGKKSVCDNYRGISLLSVPGKVLANVLCNRLRPFIDAFIGDSQCGFRAERSTVDMIFATRQLVEKALEQNTGISIAFIDIRKAFDSVNREALFQLLQHMNCPPNTLTILRKLHENTSATSFFCSPDGSQARMRASASPVSGLYTDYCR
ncbi:hypothetical protein M8J77_026153 [Diaphorina citri]|nr:hypothetical protein M8J77_026153 [Diaphorina citri]